MAGFVQRAIELGRNLGDGALAMAQQFKLQFTDDGLEWSARGSAWAVIINAVGALSSAMGVEIPGIAPNPVGGSFWAGSQGAPLDNGDGTYDHYASFGWNVVDGINQAVAGESSMFWAFDSNFFTGSAHMMSCILYSISEAGTPQILWLCSYDRDTDAVAFQHACDQFIVTNLDASKTFIDCDDAQDEVQFGAPVRFEEFAKASLPAVGSGNRMIWVTDDVGGPTPAYSDGTNWRRVSDGAVVS